MTVDVLYQGLTVATAAAARAEGDALFVELESPMPVGTALVIRSSEGERAARVERVREGMGAGMVVRFAAGGEKKVDKAVEQKPEQKAEQKKPDADTDADADAGRVDAGKKAAPEGDEPKGRKRKNTRKTVLGH